MRVENQLIGPERSFKMPKFGKFRCFQPREDGFESFRTLGMAGKILVTQAILVCDQCSCHDRCLSAANIDNKLRTGVNLRIR